MRINPFVMPVVIVLALFGTVFSAQALGYWSTSGRIAINPTTMTAADVKGWMTLQDVMTGLNISQGDLYAAGNIPADIPASTALNKLEALVPGFSVTTLREALSGDADTSATPAAPTALPTGESGLATAATPTPLANSTPVHTGDGSGTGPTPLPEGQILPASQIKGSMSLASVSKQCAVPLDKLLAGLSLPADTSSDTLIKELVAQGKLTEVTDVQKIVAGMQGP